MTGATDRPSPGPQPARPGAGVRRGAVHGGGVRGGAVRAAERVTGLHGREVAWLGALMLVAATLYTTYAWARHARYLTTGFDLGIFDQAVRAYARFQAPIVPLKAPGYNLLGDHFHPVIALWAPLYWVWDDPRMLLLAQAVLVAVSAVPVARFAARRFRGVFGEVGDGRAALVVAGVYVLSWPLQRMVQFDVHEIAFAVPLIAVLVDALDRRAYRTVLACCVGLLLTREDMGLLVLMVGVVAALGAVHRDPDGAARRRRDLAWGAALAAVGLVGFTVATGVVIPHFAGGVGFVYWTFPALGPDLPSAVRFMLRHPGQVVALMVTPARKVTTLVALGLPTLFAGLGSRYVLLTLPFLAQRFLNSRELLWTTNFHYSSVLAPILVPAGVDVVARLAARMRGSWGRRVVSGWLAWCVVVPVVGMLVLAGDYPLSRLATPRFWQRDLRVEAMAHGLTLVPSGVCVEADNAAAPQLTRRDYVTRVGRSDGLATWMLLDFSREDTGWEGPRPLVAYEQALRRGFEPVWQGNVIVVLTRPGADVAPVCRGLN